MGVVTPTILYITAQSRHWLKPCMLILHASFQGIGILFWTNFGCITICDYNCEGQDKNKITIWYILCIVYTEKFV